MTQEQNAGYYIQGWGFGGAHGPKREPSTQAYIVYGTPSTDLLIASSGGVERVERAYEVLLYTDPALQDNVYITRYDPENIVWGADKLAQPVPATPELLDIFDSKIQEWEEVNPENIDRINIAFSEGMKKAGLTGSDIPQPPDDPNSYEDMERYRDNYQVFLQAVRSHAPAVELVEVRVEGLDEIFDQIEITPQPDRVFASQ